MDKDHEDGENIFDEMADDPAFDELVMKNQKNHSPPFDEQAFEKRLKDGVVRHAKLTVQNAKEH